VCRDVTSVGHFLFSRLDGLYPWPLDLSHDQHDSVGWAKAIVFSAGLIAAALAQKAEINANFIEFAQFVRGTTGIV
jgi:hypothetical protein